MKKELLDLYNSLKATFAEGMVNNIQGNKIEFTPSIRISLPRDNDEFQEDILSMEYDAKEDAWYVHNFITEIDLMTSEYWTPLKDLSFDELFKIAERI